MATIVKRITYPDLLIGAFRRLMKTHGSAFVEKDMRAMYDPTRMKVIEGATRKLTDKINSLCLTCGTPSFGVTDAQQGLFCRLCRLPTCSTLCHIYSCK